MNLRRSAAIAGHEARMQFRSPAFWVLLAVLAFLTSALNPVAMIPSGEGAVGGVRAFANSPHALAQSFAIGSFFAYTFFAALMAGMATIRDDEAGIGDLLHATPLTPAEYALGKLAGVGAALGVALAVHVALVLLLREGGALAGVASSAHGPFRATAYLGAVFLFALPGIAWIATVAFAVGARSRRPMAVYAVPTLLFVYTILISWNFAPAALDAGLDRFLMIVDPTAIRWLDRSIFRIDRGVAHWNGAPVTFDLLFVLNRLCVLGGAGLAVAASIVRPRGARAAIRADVRSDSSRRSAEIRSKPAEPVAAPAPASATFLPLAEVAMTARAPGLLTATRTIVRSEVGELFRQPSLYLFSAFLMLVVAEVAGTESGVLASPVLLTAGGIAVRALPVVTVLVCLHLLFVVVESMHRDAVTGFEALLHAAPVADGAILLGKALAAAAVIALLVAAGVAAGLLLQLFQSGGAVEIAPLLLVFGAVLAPTYLLWTGYVTALMATLRSRNAAIAIGLATLAATAALFLSGGMSWAVNWPLWGALRWSDMGTFPLNGRALLWNRLAALGAALFLFLLAHLLFARTERDAAAGARSRTPAFLGRRVLRLAPFLLVPLLIQGFLAVQIRLGAEGAPALARAADYLRANAVPWGAVAPPDIVRIDLRIDLEPESHRMVVAGTYQLVNASPEPMARLPFTVGNTFGPVVWSSEGTPLAVENRSGLDVVTVARPVAPGAKLEIDFAYDATIPRGFQRNGGGARTFILPEGVLLSTHRGEFLPTPGFVAGDSVAGAAALSPSKRAPAFATRLEVSLPSAYSVVSVGVRTKEWETSGRRHSVWESERPVSALSLMAGRWEVRRAGHDAVYFHPGHPYQVGAMLATLTAARERYSEWFHPYPFGELRLAEYPDLATEATSYPTLISFSEGIGFLAAGPEGGEAVFSVTAHEVAHQWWGHLLPVAEGPGTGWLAEGMAHYSALLLHESERGESSRIAFARELERLYLEQRRADERPVLEAEEVHAGGEAILALKGAWVLWMLDQEVGREAMFAALRDLVARHAASRIEATPRDLLAAIALRTDDAAALRRFEEQWLEEVVLPEFEVSATSVEREPEGWRTRATVRNVGSGVVLVDVAALRRGRGRPSPETLAAGVSEAGAAALRSVRLGPGEARTIEWSLPFEPDRIEVDPFARILQANRERAAADLGTGLRLAAL